MDQLRVSGNGRFLEHEDGRPFFYLADTAWELFHALDREEARRYLTNRAEKGFTAIQAVVLAELNGLTQPTSRWVHEEPWLDFNMIQSGHGRPYQPNWRKIDDDYARGPTKPTLDGEPCYENHPVGFNRKNWRFTDYNVRCVSYWSVFHGGCGITYGCHDIWMMHGPSRQRGSFSFNYWFESLNLPGAGQMQHLRRLMESRPYSSRIPDQSVIAGGASQLSDHLAAARDGTAGEKDATYLMIYTPLHRRVPADTSWVAGDRLNVWWYDVRDGRAIRQAEAAANEGRLAVETPDEPGYDWVLVVDDAAREYPPPGQAL